MIQQGVTSKVAKKKKKKSHCGDRTAYLAYIHYKNVINDFIVSATSLKSNTTFQNNKMIFAFSKSQSKISYILKLLP